jgi:hypothetical protein
MEGVEGRAPFDVDLERVAGLGVEDRGHDQLVVLIPQQSNVERRCRQCGGGRAL